MKILSLLVLIFAALLPAEAAIRIVTSLPDLADLTRQIGGDKVSVDYIVRADQNPHFVEVKPSYMMKLKSADLFLTIGMDLELWGPQIVDGSRNDKLVVVDLSKDIHKLEVPSHVDASLGDVHRYGNPHYWLDPRNMHKLANEIIDALTGVSPSDAQTFRANADAYLKKLDAKITSWQAMMKPYAGAQIITFHKSWSYFAGWLGLTVADQIEPKPGIAPSPSHTAELISLIRKSGIKVIVVEPFYDLSAPEQIARNTGAKVLVLPTSCGGEDGPKDYIGLMDYNVNALANALK
ncbi:MAG: metal ABC transporter substrate-binding protein [Bacteroidota bacterium]